MSNSTPAPLVPSVRHITRLFRTATPEGITEGAAWYAEANSFAHTLADKYGVTVQIAAGVIAAVSPQNSWGHNKVLAERVIAEDGLTEGYMSGQLRKCDRILAGEDVATVLNGLKTVNFYLSILTAGAEGVCIDRHAWSLAVNHRYSDTDPDNRMPGLAGKRYTNAVAAYVRAAHILSREYGLPLTPAQVQSVTWELWRSKYWAPGAFDGVQS